MRIIRENREQYIAVDETGEFQSEVTGKFRFEATSKSSYPAVGDWVAVTILPGENRAMIHAVLPRKGRFSRKVAGEITEEQIVAANIDFVFIVTGLDLNYNLRRIERFLTIARESGAEPVVLLNKADLVADASLIKKEVEAVSGGVAVLAMSVYNQSGLEQLQPYLKPGKTIAFLGSSGAGKSSIINHLTGGNTLETSEVSGKGSRGRHTTTWRELIVLPGGGMVIDTPGMREIQVWGEEDGLADTFADIEELAGSCKFSDCRHESEPGCAVRTALENGSLETKRFESYVKLKNEFSRLHERQTMKASAVEKLHWKKISKLQKELKKK